MTEQTMLTGRCPQCGEELHVPAHLKQFSCMYCGARLDASALQITNSAPEATVSNEEAQAAGHSVRILAFEEHLPAYEGLDALSIGRLSEPETVSHKLFAVLREMDEAGIEVLYSEVLPAEGLGLAIMNRLSRAAGFRTIDADQL